MPKFPAHKVKVQKLEHVLDVPKYQGNENKYLKINSDGTSPELTGVAEDVQDIVGSMLVDNTQTGILATYNDDLNKIDLKVQTDDSTIQINSNNKLEVKNLGISTLKVADNAITKEKINQDIVGTGLIQESSGSITISEAFLQSEISSNTDVSNNSSARHTHSNSTVLDLLTDTAGDLYYNGSSVDIKYDQSLNTTDDVAFNSVASVDGYKIGAELIVDYTDTNTKLGPRAGQYSSGSNNFFIGSDAGKGNTGSNCVYIGSNSGRTATGNYNCGVGEEALRYATGGFNIALGALATKTLTSGAYNTAVGSSALNSSSTGNYNTAIGYQAGFSHTSSASIFIGYQAGFNETASDKLYIANNSSNPWIYGDKYSTNYRIGINTTTLTEIFTVNGSINITSGNVLKINNTQVLTLQQTAITNLSGSATLTDVINKVNTILAMLRTHGLIAT